MSEKLKIAFYLLAIFALYCMVGTMDYNDQQNQADAAVHAAHIVISGEVHP